MSLSDSLEDAGKKERLQLALLEITNLLKRSGIKYDQEDLVQNEKNATITVDGKYTFTYLDNRLRMMVPCQKCGMDQPSTPIYTLSDVSSQYENPKTMRHACMDID
jgi:hypothetical protein